MNIPPLPEGFQLDTNSQPAQDIPPLPEGFQLENSEPSQTDNLGVGSYLNGATDQPKAELSGVTDYGTANDPTVNSDGTISTVSTGQPSDYTGAFTKDVIAPVEAGTGQLIAGTRKPIAGTAKVINDGLAALGLPNEKATTDKAVRTLADYTDRYNEKNPDQMMHPSTIGELLTYSAVPVGSGVTTAATAGGAISFVGAIGDNKDYSEATKDAIIGGILTGGITKGLEMLPGNKASALYTYMLDHYNVDPATATKEFQQWRRITGEADTTKNKIKALVDNLGTQGADIKSSLVDDPIAIN